MKVRHSLAYRLALPFFFSSFLVLYLLGIVIFYSINQHFQFQDKTDLEIEQHHIITKIKQLGDTKKVLKNIGSIVKYTKNDLHGTNVLILDKDNQILFESSSLLKELVGSNLYSIIRTNDITTIEIRNNSYRILSKKIELNGESVTIIIFLNINHHQDFLNSYKYFMWIAITIATLLMGCISYLVTKRGLKPLYHLISQISLISANDLSTPLIANQKYTETVQLAASFNMMLKRLDNSFKNLINFSSDLAHELRTPLSTMKMQNQVILSKARSVNEYQQALLDNELVLDQMTKMVTDMLFLAKSDNGLLYQEISLIDLREEVLSLFEFYEYSAQEKNIKLTLSGNGKLLGDQGLLRRALSNLLANAINYGNIDSEIEVILISEIDRMIIIVKNYGNTINPKHLPHLFDRFYRVDESRTQNNDGVGLGLAIIKTIVNAHQGDISVTSENNITSFKLVFPTKRTENSL